MERLSRPELSQRVRDILADCPATVLPVAQQRSFLTFGKTIHPRCQSRRAPYISLQQISPGDIMQESEVTLSLATLRQGGCRVTIDWPRAQRTHLSFPTEEEAQRWMQRDSANWIAGHRKNKTAKRA